MTQREIWLYAGHGNRLFLYHAKREAMEEEKEKAKSGESLYIYGKFLDSRKGGMCIDRGDGTSLRHLVLDGVVTWVRSPQVAPLDPARPAFIYVVQKLQLACRIYHIEVFRSVDKILQRMFAGDR